jgi:hypothetical protein
MNETYNGWTNYETWLTALWIDNSQASYAYWRDEARRHLQAAARCSRAHDAERTPARAAACSLSQQLRDELTEGSPLTEPDLYSDLLGAALSQVNWHEVADALLDDLPEPADPASHGHEPTGNGAESHDE